MGTAAPWVPGAWGGASPKLSRKGSLLVPGGNTESDHQGAGEGREPGSAVGGSLSSALLRPGARVALLA